VNLPERCRQLPRSSRRVLALMMLPILALLAWIAAVQPLLTIYESQQAWRAEARQLLAFSKRSVAALAQLQQQIAALRGSPLWSSLYRAEPGSGVAAALQSDVGALLAAAQANVQALAPVRSVEVGALRQIGIQVVASMRIDQLQQFMTAAAAHQRYLRIGQLTVTAPQIQSATENPLLSVEMEVHGFEIPDKEAAARDAVQRAGRR
jgi:Tfp pilus assembly protein PilO